MLSLTSPTPHHQNCPWSLGRVLHSCLCFKAGLIRHFIGHASSAIPCLRCAETEGNVFHPTSFINCCSGGREDWGGFLPLGLGLCNEQFRVVPSKGQAWPGAEKAWTRRPKTFSSSDHPTQARSGSASPSWPGSHQERRFLGTSPSA